jgi:hypothetical protein
MRVKGRRRVDLLLLVVGAGAAAGIAAIGAFANNPERLDRIWTTATFRPDGTTEVHEVIDDNFGNASERHGLERRVPSLAVDAPIQVSSPDAPASINSITPYTFDDGTHGAQIRIGDATKVVHGRHRYVLDYVLTTLDRGTSILWNAVGTGWTLPIQQTDIHVVAPFAFVQPDCQTGTARHHRSCTVRQVAPGHLVVHTGALRAGQGVTITAGKGAAVPVIPAVPAPPATAPDLPGSGVALPAGVAGAGALVAALALSTLVRRAGRERVAAGTTAAGAAYGDATVGGETRVDVTKLGELATTEFAPPEGLTAPQGGIILAEQVRPQHKVAWLLEAANAGAVRIDEEHHKATRLVRTAPGDPSVKPVLDTAFGPRDEVPLGTYDSIFAAGWSELGGLLESWKRESGLWDPAGDRRRVKYILLGVLGVLLGGVALAGGGALAGRWGGQWLPLVAIGAVLAGGGFAAILRSWELRVRTPQGTGMWLRVESFRRFLHESEARHAEDAARRGVLREYTAWAVAVGEVDHWSKAVEKATAIPPDTAGLSYAYLAPSLISSTSHTSTAPSSSGGGGGIGGGGGGGGGGGNW